MREASGHTGEDLMYLSLVRKDCLVAGWWREPHTQGAVGGALRPLPKVKDLLALRRSLSPWEEARTLPQNPILPMSQSEWVVLRI